MSHGKIDLWKKSAKNIIFQAKTISSAFSQIEEMTYIIYKSYSLIQFCKYLLRIYFRPKTISGPVFDTMMSNMFSVILEFTFQWRMKCTYTRKGRVECNALNNVMWGNWSWKRSVPGRKIWNGSLEEKMLELCLLSLIQGVCEFSRGSLVIHYCEFALKIHFYFSKRQGKD